MTSPIKIVAEAPAIVSDKSIIIRAIAARKQGEKSSWEEADAYRELSDREYPGRRIAEMCAADESRVSKFLACSRMFSVLKTRPSFWEAFREVNSEKPKEPHVVNNSGNNEWYTPPEYIEAARLAMGSIDTDPASSDFANKIVKARQFFDAESDGLTQTWVGNVWMNPPYASTLIERFCEAVSEKFSHGEIEQACVLVNNGTETAWFQLLLAEASAVCFPQQRIKFLDTSGKPVNSPLQGQAVVYMGPNSARFEAEFVSFGKVLHG